MNLLTTMMRLFYGLPLYDSAALIAAKQHRPVLSYHLYNQDDDLLTIDEIEKRAAVIYQSI